MVVAWEEMRVDALFRELVCVDGDLCFAFFLVLSEDLGDLVALLCWIELALDAAVAWKSREATTM